MLTKFSEMKKKSYLLLLRSMLIVISALLILIFIGSSMPVLILVLFILLTIISVVAFFICTVWFLLISKKWKRTFIDIHKPLASFTVENCYIVELDHYKPTMIDLQGNHTFFQKIVPKSPPYYKGLITTEDIYQGFLESDGLGLPFTFGARNMVPVHYIAEGLHHIVLSPMNGECENVSFVFHVSKDKKYEIFYDESRQIVDIKDTTKEKDKFVSWI